MLHHRHRIKDTNSTPLQRASAGLQPESALAVMVYMCGCGRKWQGAEPDSQNGGTYRWTCACGTALTMTDGVIYARGPEREAPADSDSFRRLAARGGG